MKNIDYVIKSIEFIEKNLREPIKVEDVSNEVGFSLYHFSRIFNKYTGHSPYDYIMRRRLSEAAKDIIMKEDKIIDIAFDYQFNSYETFLRAFKKMFQILPNELRKRNELSGLILKSPIDYEYLLHINGKNFLTSSISKIEDMNLIGTIFSTREHRIIDKAWHEFMDCIDVLDSRVIPEELYGIVFFPMEQKTEVRRILSVKTKILDNTPSIFIGKKINKSRCLKFTYKGPLDELYMTYDYIFQTCLPKSTYKIKECYTIEKYVMKYMGKEKTIEAVEILILIE